MMLKSKTTSRKFYGKWLYKASIYIPGVAILRSKSLDDIIDFLAKPLPQTTNYRHSLNVKAHANAAYLIKLCKFLKPLQIHLWTKRIETNQLDFYTNDQSIYNDFCNKFNLILTQKFEPAANDLELLNNQYTIITKKLPHNKYRYRAFLRPHKMKGDIETTVFFFSMISDSHQFRLDDKIAKKDKDGLVTYYYENVQSKFTNSKLSDITNEYDLLIEIDKKRSHELYSIQGSDVVEFKVIQFELIDYKSNREFEDWGNEKRMILNEEMTIRYKRVWSYTPDEFKGLINKDGVSDLLKSIRREIKLGGLGL